MKTVKMHFTPRRLAFAVSLMRCSLITFAEEQPAIEEVVSLGVRGAQESAILLKRDAASLVDGIAAEDIGKLPDATITDSLQRIPGVQIRRTAGEGGAFNIRGLPQVVSQLNGEQYMAAGSVTVVQPNFSDIPAQLFKGAKVYKSSVANLGSGGISGTVDLQTRRPFDMKAGLTTAANLEIQRSADLGGADPVLSGLVNYSGEKFGFMAAVSMADVNLANSYNGFNTFSPGDVSWVETANDHYEAADELLSNEYIVPQGWVAWNQETERERSGFSSSFQWDMGEGFQLIADFFHTDQQEYNRKVGVSVTNRWQWGLNWLTPNDPVNTGHFRDWRFYDDQGNLVTTEEREWLSYTSADLDVLRLKSFTQNDSFHNRSNNLNIELLYNRGGPLTGSVRFVHGKASQQRRHGYNEGDLTDWSDTNSFNLDTFYPAEVCDSMSVPQGSRVGDQGGCFVSPNADGYASNPQLSIDFSGNHPSWSGWDTPLNGGGLGTGASARDYMANLPSYAIGAFSSENNSDSTGRLDVFRLDGQYRIDDSFFSSVEMGIRMSQRAVAHEAYHLFSPFYAGVASDPAGCLAQWKAVDIEFESELCSAGELVDGQFQPYTALPPTELNEHNNVIWVSDFGPVDSIPGVWAVDPKDYDDPEAFHKRVFGSVQRATVPGSSYNVDLDELTYYLQTNFKRENVSGNLGVRVVDSSLTVKQNLTGETLPFGNTNKDTGDVLTKRDFTEVLPSLNVAFDLSNALKLRFAAAKTMTSLDLANWGDGLAVNTTNNQDPDDNVPDGTFTVSSASLNGNPQLDPWLATNFDAALEWYFGLASVVNVGIFKIDIDSFTQAGTVPLQIADSDGIVRRTTYASTQVQGKGGSLSGVELGVKLSLSDIAANQWFSGFGVDANYTYSPSEQDSKDIQGRRNPFPDNSETQLNFVLWYQAERLQTRLAYNHRTDRLASAGVTSAGLNLYQAPTTYLDVSVSYDINEHFSVYLNGSNITGEYEDYYLEFEDQYAFQNYYEPRYALGLRARF